MTEEELQKEHRYRKEERLGILCGAAVPTPEQTELATNEADKAIEQLRNEPDQGTNHKAGSTI